MATARVHQVVPRVHEVFLPLPMRPSIVNVWLIDGGSEWALIDTGMRTDDSLAAFREALSTLGIEPTTIRKILCTHHHPDHFGASGPLRELCGADEAEHEDESAGWDHEFEGFKPEGTPDAVLYLVEDTQLAYGTRAAWQ